MPPFWTALRDWRPGFWTYSTIAIVGGVLSLNAMVGRQVGDATGQAASEHLGLRVKSVEIQGASREAAPEIAKTLEPLRGTPLLLVSPQAVADDVARVGWVRTASVRRAFPDRLVVSVEQKRPLSVWQHDGRHVVIDVDGRVVTGADAAHFPTLPLVVGLGAAEHAPEILPLIAARPFLAKRMEALVRVDDRRWDIRLKTGGIVQLPAAAPGSALEIIDRLQTRYALLDLGFEKIDLRLPDTMVVRPGASDPDHT